MTYNKKQMQPLIDKYAINPETNKLFINVMEMFDNQPNYQIWAVKMIFSKVMDIEQLETIHEWVSKNQTMVRMLEKQNVVSYSSKSLINQLFKEMKGLDNLVIIKDTINHFNTEQRKMLSDALLSKEYTALEAYNNDTIKKWSEIFKKFNRLPFERKKKFYSNCSRLKNLNDLLSAIDACLLESYKWDKEDFLAFLANNTDDCEIVYNNGPYVVVHVGSFKSSQLLCGNGRTSWCITQQESYWSQYVSGYSNRDQYFMFDFSRKECDAFAHIGFTMENGRGFYCAQTCNNQDMRNGFRQGDEIMNISQALEKAGVKMNIFLRLNPLVNYKWDFDSIINFVKARPSGYGIAYEKDGRLIINILNTQAIKELCSHTLISQGNFNVDNNNKVYVFIDTNLPYNDDKSLFAMLYQKDSYGALSLKRIADPFNTDMTRNGYLSQIGISSDCFLNRESIDPKVLLHKYIDENDELAAIKLIEKEGKEFNVNYEFNQRLPIISAINQKMYNLFDKIVNHPKFDSSAEDGFGETLLESLIYLYSSEEISSSKKEETELKRMIISILNSTVYDFNAKDLNSDTAINIACEYPKMLWIVEALASKKEVDINNVNDFECAALGACIRNKNLEALKIIGQRPDVKVSDEDKKLAKSYGINLSDYIKPNEAIFGSFKFEGEYASPTTLTTNVQVGELELAMGAI
jgi:hypothetical protein